MKLCETCRIEVEAVKAPDYERDGIKLYLGDCLEILPTLGKVDAVVTDPPYGIATVMVGGTWGASAGYEQMRSWDRTTNQEGVSLAISKAKRAIVWGGNFYNLPINRGWLSWLKKGRAPTMADFELAWTNIDMCSRGFQYHIEGGFLRECPQFRHPTQKPIPLMEWCLGFLPDSETILDPFMGSGTTGIACIRTGRKFIGIEIEPKYFEIARNRIDHELSHKQLRMFA